MIHHRQFQRPNHWNQTMIVGRSLINNDNEIEINYWPVKSGHQALICNKINGKHCKMTCASVSNER